MHLLLQQKLNLLNNKSYFVPKCKLPRPCLQGICGLRGRQTVTGDCHASYLLWIAESFDHSQPQVSQFFCCCCSVATDPMDSSQPGSILLSDVNLNILSISKNEKKTNHSLEFRTFDLGTSLGGPVVKTLYFQCREHRMDPWLGN